MRGIICYFIVSVVLSCVIIQATGSPTLLYQWTAVDYVWESDAQRLAYTKDGQYIVENNAICGVKSWNNEVYVTVPRWRPGVPSTLNKVVVVEGETLLEPYPSWDLQEIGNPSALQFVQSMEIDSRGWMWIIDVGRLNLLSDPDLVVNYAPKLIVWDMKNNCVIRSFVFPNSVVAWNNSFLNDIVVDETNGFAYISNTFAEGGIIVYDFNHNIARQFHDDTLNGDASNMITINGKSYNVPFPSDGIALSHDTRTVYYCDLSRNKLWSVPTRLLQDFSLTSPQISKGVVYIGTKGYSDGMAYAANGILYFGDIAENAVNGWNAASNIPLNSSFVLNKDDKYGQWPDTFAFDGRGNLLYMANKLQLYVFGGMKFDGTDGANFRLWSVPVNSSSYLTGKPVPQTLSCEIFN